MDIQYLHEFVILAESCNFQEAAESLHVSQSALSKHIQKLEDEIGEVLFERSARSASLSQYGEAFLGYARQITALREDALRHLQRIRAADNHWLVIACPPALERYGLVELLTEFRRSYPNYKAENIRSVDPVGALRAGRCDFAITQEDVRDMPDISVGCCLENYPVAVLPEHHPLASASVIPMAQLRNETFILYNRAEENTTIPQTTLSRLCASAGFAPTISMSASFSSTIVSLVSQGLGISVMERLQVPANVGKVALVRIEVPRSTDIQIIYMKSARPSAIRTAFLQYVTHQKTV